MIRDQLAAALRAALSTLEVTPLPDTINLERPARREHGDWSSNVALATGKKAGWNPRELAGRLAEILNADRPDHVTSVEIAGPGFVNFRLADSWLHDVLVDVRQAGVDGYARADGRRRPQGAGRVREREPHRAAARRPRSRCRLRRLVGPGPRTGRLRRSPARTTSTTAASRCRSSSTRWRPGATGVDVPDDGYHGQYVIDWAAEIPEGVDSREALWEWGEARAVEDHRETLGRMNVHFDSWFSRTVDGRVRCHRDDARRPARARRRLRPRRRGVVALDRLRRRQGPRAGQERRRVHLPAARHRLPPRQVRPRLRSADRRVGRRPPRLRARG